MVENGWKKVQMTLVWVICRLHLQWTIDKDDTVEKNRQKYLGRSSEFETLCTRQLKECQSNSG